MVDQPTGLVTFLFTTIDDAARLWDRYPEAMPAAIARHNALLQAAIASCQGHIFRIVGDAFYVAFSSALHALHAAIAAQRALLQEPWETAQALSVRMALHSEFTEPQAGNYDSPPLNRVARLLAAGSGGQILLSGATAEQVRPQLLSGVRLRDLGERQLRDLSQPMHIFQVLAPGLPCSFSALKTLDPRPTNLPAPTTSLIGRTPELTLACQLLQREDVRLLTLSGPGGTGKTRLSVELATSMLDEYADGVFFVELAPLSDPLLVISAISQALGLKETGGTSPVERLKQHLSSRQMLLVLDNFEQVVAAAPLVHELLAAAPRLKVLVTSREVLHLPEEFEFPVPPLAVPTPAARLGAAEQAAPLDWLTRSPAVALFTARAQAVEMAFNLTIQNALAVAEICQRLDGLPLAIELAAARVRMLPPQAMLARLTSRLNVLTGGARDLPARQRTLRGAIDWSYELLSQHERRLFAWLGVFVGGCTLETAQAICADPELLAPEIKAGIDSLVSKSLLQQERGPAGPRYTMLETIREYALERLEQSRELPLLRRRHASYFLTLVEEAAPELNGPAQGDRLSQLELEHNNLRAALTWTLEADEVDMAARLGRALSRFWQLHGHLSEGRRWLERVLERRDKLPLALQAKILQKAGVLIWMQGHYATARKLYEESLELARQVGDEPAIARALNDLGIIATEQGDYGPGRSYHEQALAIRRRLGHKPDIAQSLNNLGELARWQAQYDQAGAYYEEGLALCRELGHMQGIAILLGNLGVVACQQGDYQRARALFAENLAIERALGYKWLVSYSLEGIAGLAARQGAPLLAVRLLGAAEALRFALGSPLPPVERAHYEQIVGLARKQLDEASFNAAWAEGRGMALEEAIHEALVHSS